MEIHEVPKWLQDNHYIHSGYRQASYSYARSFASALHVHNETVNIWSHGLPALLSLPTATVLYHALKPRYGDASQPDVVVMGIFFFSIALAMGMSASFHALSNHSPSVAKFWNQLDYAGISCLIAGSFVPSVYYGFWCDPKRQVVYWAMVSSIRCALTEIGLLWQIFALGTGCTAASVLPRFRTPDWRPFRAAMFVGMGLSAVIPVMDGMRLYSLNQMLRQMGLGWVVLQGLLYIVGAGLYAVSPKLTLQQWRTKSCVAEMAGAAVSRQSRFGRQ